ncbi:MAG: hypothetical protein FJW96_09065 [Actinobacteria bacterium]|nr:hypothetical protein [Actinomycetota bacterium]
MDDRTIGRAAFLGLLGAGVAGLFVTRDVGNTLGRLLPDGPAFIPGSSGWRIYTIGNGLPRIDLARYRLRIDGAVERPVTLTLGDLRRLPAASRRPTSTASPAGRWRTCAGRACGSPTCWRSPVRFRARSRCGSSPRRCRTTTR